MLHLLIGFSIASDCLAKAYNTSCKNLLHNCSNDYICAYDLFV